MKIVGAGLAAVVIAGAGGVAGGLLVHSIDMHGTSGTATTVRPVVQTGSMASIAKSVTPSVVAIATQDAEGSGVVLSADGYLLTNNHVVAGAANGTVKVTFSTGKQVTGKVVGTDARTDLAVVKAAATGLVPATFGDSGAIQVGDPVLAIGNPLGLDSSVTAGIVSALNRTIHESADQQSPFGQGQSAGASIAGAIQTDAAINPGNSGGALVNMSGQVIGINTAIATAGTNGNIGVGFAIPSNRAKQVATDLIAGHAVSHPYLGVSVGDAANDGGAQVGAVVSGSPAQQAGLQAGDVITAADGTQVHSSDDLLNAVQAGKVGDQLTLTVLRNGSERQITVTLGDAPK